MNNKHIHDYLDGGLDAGAERDLFAAMGESDELRQEFSDQQRIHAIVKKDMAAAVTPPELTASVFAELGFTPPGVAPATPAAPFWGKFLAWLGGTTGYVLTGIGAAVFTVWLLMPETERVTSKSIPALRAAPSKGHIEEVAINSVGNLNIGSGVTSKSIPALRAVPSKGHENETALQNSAELRENLGETPREMGSRNSNSLRNLPRKQEGTQRVMTNSAGNLNLELGVTSGKQGRDASFSSSTPLIKGSPSSAGELSVNPRKNSGELGEEPLEKMTMITAAALMSPRVNMPAAETAGRIEIRQQQEKPAGGYWTFNVRTVQHISSNFDQVIFIFKPYLSAGAMYSFNPYHALGGEAGYESFQSTATTADNASPQTQDVWWGGISYKASFPQLSPTELITPDLRLSLGMTTTGGTPTPGAIFRATGGLTFAPGNGTHYSVGLESAWLFLPGNGNFTPSQRFGFVLGAGIEL